MYHIKDDKRAYKSSELIFQGLFECLKSKAFKEITISDIQRVSSVGRATFYRNFDSLIDVLHWRCDLQYKTMMEEYTRLLHHDESSTEFLRYFFGYWMFHSDVLEILINLGRYDIVYQSHYDNSKILYEYFRDSFVINQETFEYYMALRIGAFVNILIAWIKNGKKESVDRLVDIIEKLITDLSGSPLII